MTRACDSCGVPRHWECICFGPGAARRDMEEAAAEQAMADFRADIDALSRAALAPAPVSAEDFLPPAPVGAERRKDSHG
jgi:hypothetical protein